ncbi:hypothetical protein ACP70R_017666 [Stipagrostis hirtigluma subsp. patula]
MESSSHITGDDGDEGCNSSESGWTMYLVSPLHGDDSGGAKGSGSEGSSVDDGYGYIISDRRSGKAYEDDDDSLASDASTGPAKVKVPPMPEGSTEEGGGRGKSGDGGSSSGGKEEEQEEDDARTKFSTSSRKKAGKVDKGGEGKSSRRGHGKKGSSSRTSFFFW